MRISFAGGGTDLPAYYERFGGAVLSTSINKYFYTILGKRTDGRIQVISSDLRVFETWRDIANMNIRGMAASRFLWPYSRIWHAIFQWIFSCPRRFPQAPAWVLPPVYA